jgi:hypothetical protein
MWRCCRYVAAYLSKLSTLSRRAGGLGGGDGGRGGGGHDDSSLSDDVPPPTSPSPASASFVVLATMCNPSLKLSFLYGRLTCTSSFGCDSISGELSSCQVKVSIANGSSTTGFSTGFSTDTAGSGSLEVCAFAG